MNLEARSLMDLMCGDRVRMTGNGVNETFQATATIGRVQWFISLQFGHEYTRPQLITKYMRAGSTFEVRRLPEQGWPV